MVRITGTNYEVAQVDKVMDGDIDGFIDAYLKWRLHNVEGINQKRMKGISLHVND